MHLRLSSLSPRALDDHDAPMMMMATMAMRTRTHICGLSAEANFLRLESIATRDATRRPAGAALAAVLQRDRAVQRTPRLVALLVQARF